LSRYLGRWVLKTPTPPSYKDPFDRILAAQSQVEAAKIKGFGVQTFW